MPLYVSLYLALAPALVLPHMPQPEHPVPEGALTEPQVVVDRDLSPGTEQSTVKTLS